MDIRKGTCSSRNLFRKEKVLCEWLPATSLVRLFLLPGEGPLVSSPLGKEQCVCWYFSPWLFPELTWGSSGQVCSFLQRATRHWIDFQHVPYAYKGKEWVGYDDAMSFSHKVRPWSFLAPAYSFLLAPMRLLSVQCV